MNDNAKALLGVPHDSGARESGSNTSLKGGKEGKQSDKTRGRRSPTLVSSRRTVLVNRGSDKSYGPGNHTGAAQSPTVSKKGDT